MLSLSVDSSRYQVLWSEAEGPAVGSGHTHTPHRLKVRGLDSQGKVLGSDPSVYL